MQQTPPARLTDPRLRPVVVGVVGLMTLVAFATVASSTVMPVIARDLDGLGGYVWGFSSAAVTSLLGIVIGGILCDAWGPRSGLVAGVVALGLGSALCAVAPNFTWFVGARFVQGFGGGALMVTAYVVVARAIPDGLRPRAMAALAAAWVVPVFAGAVLAGWLADAVNWRAIYAAVPLLAIAMLLAVAPHVGDLSGTGILTGSSRQVGSALLAVGSLLLIQDAAARASTLSVPETLLGAAVLLVALRALLPEGAVTLRRGLPTATMMRGILSSGYFASAAFLPLALVEIHGASATEAGLVMGVAGLGWWVGSTIQGRINTPARLTRLVSGGAMVVAGSLMLMSLVVVLDIPTWVAALLVAACEVGLGLSVPAASVQVFRMSADEQQGFNSSAMQVGDTVLTVVLASVLSVIYAQSIQDHGMDTWTFGSMWIIAGLPALLGALVAPRMRQGPRA